MISVFFHLGDWTTSTVDLSPTERGVYFDLLCRYYQKERPLMQEECTRIARAYAPHEQEAMQYVLQTFFELKDGVYVHARCEEEIQKMRLTIGKRKKAAEARWSRAREGKSETDGDASAEALSMHADCKCISKCNADAMQTINHKPETTNQIEKSATRSTRKRAVERPEEIDPQVWEDWLKVRAAKKSPLTPTAWKRIETEAKQARRSLQYVIQKCAERGWVSYKAEWDRDEQKDNPFAVPPENPFAATPSKRARRQDDEYDADLLAMVGGRA